MTTRGSKRSMPAAGGRRPCRRDRDVAGHDDQVHDQRSPNVRPGNTAMLGRLTELMFVEILREYMQQLPADHGGWLAGLNDPHVGKALRLLHASPMRNWTVEELSREVGDFPVRSGRAVHAAGRRSADAVPRQLAHAACEAAAEGGHAQHPGGRDACGVRVRGRVQPGVQARHRFASGHVAPGSVEWTAAEVFVTSWRSPTWPAAADPLNRFILSGRKLSPRPIPRSHGCRGDPERGGLVISSAVRWTSWSPPRMERRRKTGEGPALRLESSHLTDNGAGSPKPAAPIHGVAATVRRAKRTGRCLPVTRCRG